MVYEIPMVENYGNGFYKITTVSTTVSTTTPTVTTRFLHTLLTLRLSQVVHWVSIADRASGAHSTRRESDVQRPKSKPSLDQM